MRFRVKFNKKNYLKYISHLDLMRLFERSFSRAKLPIEFSNGFNPKPKISIASPLSLGIESEEEWMDLELTEKIDEKDFIRKINNILPRDVQVLDAEYIQDKTPIAALINWSLYEISFLTLEDYDKKDIKELMDGWLKRDEIFIQRYRKKGRQKILVTENVAALMREVEIKEINHKSIILRALLKIGESGTLRPRDFISAFIEDNNLKVDLESINFKRIQQRI